MSGLTLYTNLHSSCAYRVRIALALKGLDYTSQLVNMAENDGENLQGIQAEKNPLGFVPMLSDGNRVYTQSMAIIEFLDETYPEPILLPVNIRDRAYVRALAQMVVSDIQPLNNLRVMNYLEQTLAIDEEQSQNWYRHWLSEGLQAVEKTLASHDQAGEHCCYVNMPTLADICLIPQVYDAMRVGCDLEPYPRVRGIYDYCTSLPAFRSAAPENQPGAV